MNRAFPASARVTAFCLAIAVLPCSGAADPPEPVYKGKRTLARIGPKAKGAVPALIEAAHDRDPFYRINAARARGHRAGRQGRRARPDQAP